MVDGPPNFNIFRRPDEDRVMKEAREFCQDIKQALELAARRKEEDSEELRRMADQAAVSVIHHSMFDSLPYHLLVSLPDDTEAHISRNWTILDDKPKTFIATDVRAISPQQVEFHHNPTDNWLIVFGHNMDIEPVFPDSIA
jgi:hypothetical protein